MRIAMCILAFAALLLDAFAGDGRPGVDDDPK